jgi:DNA topoisomerase VI subunit A
MHLGMRTVDLDNLDDDIFQPLTDIDRRKIENLRSREFAEVEGVSEELEAMDTCNSKAEIEAFSAATGLSVAEWLSKRLQLRAEAVHEHNWYDQNQAAERLTGI